MLYNGSNYCKCLTLLLLLSLTTTLSACKSTTQVVTRYGILEGVQTSEIKRFLGIPYARSPVGELRWADPQQPEPWDGVLDASKMGHACTQFGVGLLVNSPSEDCLTLNIWVPNTLGPHPVMVWIHGGGLMSGASNELQYDASTLAKAQNVVVVSINYRLLTSGFFALPALGSRPAISGNQAIKDQIAALQWIQSEITQFGGDPNNVTIFGESAGSFSTCALLATPKTQSPRLFNRAIMESGVCETFEIQTLEQAQWHGFALLTLLGCAGADEPLDCARALPIETIRNVTKMNLFKSFPLRFDEWPFQAGLVIDGDLFPEHPTTLLSRHPRRDTPILLGVNKDEGSLFAGFRDHPGNAEDYEPFLDSRYPGRGADFSVFYPMENYNNAGHAHAALRGDLLFKCPTLRLAQAHSAANPVWMYHFTHDVYSPFFSFVTLGFGENPPPLGTFHSAEIGFIFDFPLLTSFTRPSDRKVRALFQQAWGNFARTGNPNGPGIPDWEPFVDHRNNYLEINATPSNQDNFREGACELLEDQP